ALKAALIDLEKHIKSKKTVFVGGELGLSMMRARAIASQLKMMLKGGHGKMSASVIAAESHGFSRAWGGQRIREWARKYMDHVNKVKMLNGLKKYLELELFPRIQYKAGSHGIAICTARRWLHANGFESKSHAKGLYYDGHERPDVVHDQQHHFLPQMAQYAPRLVWYAVGDVNTAIIPSNFVERLLVLVAHNEMTAQANDGKKASWIYKGEQPLCKKGVGRGLHQSEIICSTVGWLADASQTLEYGKNYKGYWTGELFVKQLKEKIIPAFEAAHGLGYQALIMVDNSQGHSADALDALLIFHMNMNPGGKQALMRNGWFEQNRKRTIQSMVFPPDHHEPAHRGQAKGMKVVLMERGLWRAGCYTLGQSWQGWYRPSERHLRGRRKIDQ
ncbi:hypothetical protein K439DRAFT_1367698, partial [Ramaria rubella]